MWLVMHGIQIYYVCLTNLITLLLGLPTLHAGCWLLFDENGCTDVRCQVLHEEWRELVKAGTPLTECHQMECAVCKQERERRNRLITPGDSE